MRYISIIATQEQFEYILWDNKNKLLSKTSSLSTENSTKSKMSSKRQYSKTISILLHILIRLIFLLFMVCLYFVLLEINEIRNNFTLEYGYFEILSVLLILFLAILVAIKKKFDNKFEKNKEKIISNSIVINKSEENKYLNFIRNHTFINIFSIIVMLMLIYACWNINLINANSFFYDFIITLFIVYAIYFSIIKYRVIDMLKIYLDLRKLGYYKK